MNVDINLTSACVTVLPVSDVSLLTVFDVLLKVPASGAADHLKDAHTVAVSEKKEPCS